MAFLLNQARSLSHLRSNPQLQKGQESLYLPNRAFHVEPGAREKALLAEDPSLKRFKSHKKGVWRIKRMGDILTIVVVTGCCYEIYVRATMREEARKQAGGSA